MSDSIRPLHGATLSIAEFAKQPTQWKKNVLGAICFSTAIDESQMQAVIAAPCARVRMRRLDINEPACEVWSGSGRPTQGQSETIHYRHDDEVLFGVITLPEILFQADVDKMPLQQATESAYRQVFELLDTLHYPFLFRFWNYIADINSTSFGLERYQQFNLGRQDAFLAHGRDVVGNVPAACALGSSQGPLTIAFLAGRVEPRNIENPRQVSAYQYPKQYGPSSPTFSRASLVRLAQDELLFISGTASIVGHTTLHPADVVAQASETMTNIETVLAEANRLADQPSFDLSNLHYKVYVRHPTDLLKIRTELTRHVGSEPEAVYLHADVCRQDLLLEIEANAEYSYLSMPSSRD